MWQYRQLSQKLLFCDISRIICCDDFVKCGNINYQKLRKQPAKYPKLGIAPLFSLALINGVCKFSYSNVKAELDCVQICKNETKLRCEEK